MSLSGQQIITALAGQLQSGATMTASDGPFRRVVLDSRTVEPGDLFIALPGEHVDGHDFVPEAVARGAKGLLVQRSISGLSVPVAQVSATLRALQTLGAWWRAQHQAEVIGVTGSVGKTTAKELIATVLGRCFSTYRSPGNLNSESGLPLALLGLEGEHRYAVLEMAMYDVGEIALLCRLARPRYGVVTAIGPVHLSRLGSMDRILQAKGELLEALPPEGAAFLNADDPLVCQLAARCRAPVLWYGCSSRAQVRATAVVSRGLEGLSFRLGAGRASLAVKTGLLGRYQLPGALAAAAVGLHLGMSLEEVAQALSGDLPPQRLRVLHGPRGITVLDDSYNASPASVKGALDLLAEVPGRHVAVLGDMRELGSQERRAHRAVGHYVVGSAEVLVAVGELGRLIGQEATRSGLSSVSYAADGEAAWPLLAALLRPGDVVLVKGSRALELERLVAAVAEEGQR